MTNIPDRNDTALLYRIAFTRIPGIGPVRGRKLEAATAPPHELLQYPSTYIDGIPELEKFLHPAAISNALKEAESELRFLIKNEIEPIYYTDKAYPIRLEQCEDAPMMLFKKGTCELNPRKIIAMVGTRNATDYGREFCESFLDSISEVPGLVVVSGLAHGIDAIVHRCCLDFGIPTIGVLGHGLDRMYPFVHASIARQMAENDGALLTEFGKGTNPDRENFPQRNRIVAGMCDATIVVEAAEKGGALITAELASGYGREVFALPGRNSDFFSRGCNRLIRDNKAALIENYSDFLKLMGWDENKRSKPKQITLFADLDDQEQVIWSHLKQQGEQHIDELALALKIPVHKISSVLLGIEMKGAIASMKGKMYKAL